jgi:hypothetical protein
MTGITSTWPPDSIGRSGTCCRMALRLTSDLNSAIVRVIGGRVGTSVSWFARAAAALRLVGGSYYFSHPAQLPAGRYSSASWP